VVKRWVDQDLRASAVLDSHRLACVVGMGMSANNAMDLIKRKIALGKCSLKIFD